MYFRCLLRAKQSESVVQHANSRWCTFARFKPALPLKENEPNNTEKSLYIMNSITNENSEEITKETNNPSLISCKLSSTV